MRNKRPKNADELNAIVKENLGFHTTSAVPQTDHLHARRIEAVIKTKEPLPRIEYICI